MSKALSLDGELGFEVGTHASVHPPSGANIAGTKLDQTRRDSCRHRTMKPAQARPHPPLEASPALGAASRQ